MEENEKKMSMPEASWAMPAEEPAPMPVTEAAPAPMEAPVPEADRPAPEGAPVPPDMAKAPAEPPKSPKARKSFELKRFVLLALFVALIILLGLTPLGLIPLGFINVTILCVPVVVGTLLLGLKSGLVLGAAFGGVSFASALIKPSSLVSTLMGASPVLVFLLCVLPRLCVPVVAWAVDQWFEKRSESLNVAYVESATVGGIFNVLVFLLMPGWLTDAGCSAAVANTLTALIGLVVGVGLGFLVFRLLNLRDKAVAVAAVCGSLTNTVLYLGMMLLFYVLCGIGSKSVLTLIGGTALLAGSMEAVTAALLTTPILAALRHIKL